VSFHKQSFQARFASMGDEAEGIYEQVLPIGNSIPFGWRRPKVSMKNMTNKISNMPDFYAGAGYLVECMGCGTDKLLKLKTNKWEALKGWNQDQDVMLFVWNSKLREWFLLDWEGMKRAYAAGKRVHGVKRFHDGPQYVAIPWAVLEAQAVLGGEVELVEA